MKVEFINKIDKGTNFSSNFIYENMEYVNEMCVSSEKDLIFITIDFDSMDKEKNTKNVISFFVKSMKMHSIED